MSAESHFHSPEGPYLRSVDGSVFALKSGKTIIGRVISCDIQIQDPCVSRRHCALTWSMNDISVDVLGTSNPTFVNDKCIRKGQSCVLFHRDRLLLGRTALTFFNFAAETDEPEQGAEARKRLDADSTRSPSESTILSFDLDPLFPAIDKQPSTDAALRELRKAYERLSIFYDLGREVGNIFDLDSLLAKVARRIRELMPVDSGVILLRRLDSYEPFLCWSNKGFQDTSRARFSRTLVARAIEQKRGLFIPDVTSQPGLADASSVERHQIASSIIAPILIADEVLGAICLSACGRDADFGPDDLALVSGVAGEVAIAVKNTHLADEVKRTTAEKERFEREIEIAAHVQRSILPTAPPSISGLDIAGVSTAAREVGGDFFDYVHLGDNSLGTTIGDVSGKGLAAALFTLQSKNVIHAFAIDNFSPADVLRKANSVMYDDYSRAEMFLSAFYAIVDLPSKLLRYASAGHNPPLLLKADGTCSFLNSTGSLLGIFSDLAIDEEATDLARGDVLALYTDGVSEAKSHSGPQFGCKRLTEKLREYHDLPAHEIADRILQDVASHTGRIHFDDATLVVIKVQS